LFVETTSGLHEGTPLETSFRALWVIPDKMSTIYCSTLKNAYTFYLS